MWLYGYIIISVCESRTLSLKYMNLYMAEWEKSEYMIVTPSILVLLQFCKILNCVISHLWRLVTKILWMVSIEPFKCESPRENKDESKVKAMVCIDSHEHEWHQQNRSVLKKGLCVKITAQVTCQQHPDSRMATRSLCTVCHSSSCNSNRKTEYNKIATIRKQKGYLPNVPEDWSKQDSKAKYHTMVTFHT